MGGRDTRRDTGTPSGHPMEHQRAIAALDGRRDGRTDGGETFVLISLQQRSDHFTRPPRVQLAQHRRRCPPEACASVRQRTGRHTAHHVRSVHVELAVSTKIQQLWSWRELHVYRVHVEHRRVHESGQPFHHCSSQNSSTGRLSDFLNEKAPVQSERQRTCVFFTRKSSFQPGSAEHLLNRLRTAPLVLQEPQQDARNGCAHRHTTRTGRHPAHHVEKLQRAWENRQLIHQGTLWGLLQRIGTIQTPQATRRHRRAPMMRWGDAKPLTPHSNAIRSTTSRPVGQRRTEKDTSFHKPSRTTRGTQRRRASPLPEPARLVASSDPMMPRCPWALGTMKMCLLKRRGALLTFFCSLACFFSFSFCSRTRFRRKEGAAESRVPLYASCGWAKEGSSPDGDGGLSPRSGQCGKLSISSPVALAFSPRRAACCSIHSFSGRWVRHAEWGSFSARASCTAVRTCRCHARKRRSLQRWAAPVTRSASWCRPSRSGTEEKNLGRHLCATVWTETSGGFCFRRLPPSRTRGSQCTILRSPCARLVLLSFTPLPDDVSCAWARHGAFKCSMPVLFLFSQKAFSSSSSFYRDCCFAVYLCAQKNVSYHLRLMSKSVKPVTALVRRFLNSTLRSLGRKAKDGKDLLSGREIWFLYPTLQDQRDAWRDDRNSWHVQRGALEWQLHAILSKIATRSLCQ